MHKRVRMLTEDLCVNITWEMAEEVLKNVKKATEHDGCSFKAWHRGWGIMYCSLWKSIQSSIDSLYSLENQINQHTDSAISLEFTQVNTLRQQSLHPQLLPINNTFLLEAFKTYSSINQRLLYSPSSAIWIWTYSISLVCILFQCR